MSKISINPTLIPIPTQFPSSQPSRDLPLDISDIEDSVSSIIEEELYKLPCPAINYHVCRVCNYRCKFCFHRAAKKIRDSKSSSLYPLSDSEIYRGLEILKAASGEKLNIAGGEPSLWSIEKLVFVISSAKKIGFKCVSIISNVYSFKKEDLPVLKDAGLDILGISLHSSSDAGCEEIGYYHAKYARSPVGTRASGTISHIKEICAAAHECGLHLKINTTLCVPNAKTFKSLAEFVVKDLQPCRWKIFQAIPLGSNEEEGVEKAFVDEEEKILFLTEKEYNKAVDPVVAKYPESKFGIKIIKESSKIMRNSYVVLDELMRPIDSSTGAKMPQQSILDEGGIEKAMRKVVFDGESFKERSGNYFQDLK
ncbi:radical SAM enzyme [Aduncisulcus paluster]|uniref:Radical SAM enzyme n=1 Tax=Aduncisulcus paluster TaxID=2918883 RepID=A0ABQ5KS75_9EUKA|nr:radical SAM enzyme [Aduncisulcus paluster]